MDAAETRPQGIKATTENRGGWRNVSCSSSIPPPPPPSPPPLPPASPPNQLLQTSVLTTILSVFLSSLAGGGLLLQLLLPVFILPFAYVSFFLTLFICFITPSLVTPSISHLLLSYFSDSFIVVLFLWNCQRLSWKKLLLLYHLLSPSQCSFVLRLGESLEKPGEA